MATFNKFQSFVEALAEGAHNLGSDTLEVALTNTLPVNTHTQLSDITQISYANCSARVLTVASSAQTSGVYKLVINDLTLTATGGAVGPFQWVVIFNQTSTNDLLIGWYALAAATTLNDGENILLDFDATNGLLQLS